MVRETPLRTSSPVAWPNLSLKLLKSSMSIRKTLKHSLCLLTRSTSSNSLSRKYLLLKRPVRGSVIESILSSSLIE